MKKEKEELNNPDENRTRGLPDMYGIHKEDQTDQPIIYGYGAPREFPHIVKDTARGLIGLFFLLTILFFFLSIKNAKADTFVSPFFVFNQKIATNTATPVPTNTVIPTDASTITPANVCIGDTNNNCKIDVHELVTMVRQLLDGCECR